MELSIQERLKDLRVERGLTLEQLEEQVNLSKSALGSYEAKDFKDISHYAIIKLAKFYGVTADYLLGLSQTRNHPNADLADLRLSDDMIELLKSGRVDNSLLCELAAHPDFPRLIADLEIYVNGVAVKQVQTVNAIVNTMSATIMKQYKLCDKKAVKKDWIEDLVVNYTMKAIMNDEVMERLIDTLMELQKKESTDLPLLKKQLAETEKGINNMLNAIQAGIFTPSTKQRLDELEETKSQLEVSILQEEMHKPLLTREQIAFFIYRFRKFDVTKREQRQRLIDSFVNAVYLYEDKIILTFNYKDGSKTITLAEVEGSDLSVLGAPKRKTSALQMFFFLLLCPDARLVLDPGWLSLYNGKILQK